jgi:hypothetical protein
VKEIRKEAKGPGYDDRSMFISPGLVLFEKIDQSLRVLNFFAKSNFEKKGESSFEIVLSIVGKNIRPCSEKPLCPRVTLGYVLDDQPAMTNCGKKSAIFDKGRLFEITR